MPDLSVRPPPIELARDFVYTSLSLIAARHEGRIARFAETAENAALSVVKGEVTPVTPLLIVLLSAHYDTFSDHRTVKSY